MNENEQKKQENAAFHANAPTEKKDAPRNSGRNRPHRGGKNRNNGKDRPAGNRPGAPGTKTLPATARMIERRNPRPKTPRPEIRKAGTKRRRKTAETSAEISKIIESRKRNSPMLGHRKKRTTTVVPIPTARKIKAEDATVASLPQRHAARNRRRRWGEAFWILPRKKMRCSGVSPVKARRPLGAG